MNEDLDVACHQLTRSSQSGVAVCHSTIIALSVEMLLPFIRRAQTAIVDGCRET